MRDMSCLRLIAAVIGLIMLLLAVPDAYAAPRMVSPRMRPYAGIGVLMFEQASGPEADMVAEVPLYAEPAINRIAVFNTSSAPRHEWIFGSNPGFVPLIVTDNKGDWLQVAYDDAGREAWLVTPRKSAFAEWQRFLKGRHVSLLPGLQKRYYQLYQQPGQRPVMPLPGRKSLKVIGISGDWAMVMSGQNSLHWLRWRDEDGRLLVGLR